MKMSGFAKLIPAFIARGAIDAPFSIGNVSTTGSLTVVPLREPSATNSNANSYIRSLDSYPLKLNATFLHGSDFIRTDEDGKHLRLDVRSVLKDSNTGGLIAFKYTGIIHMTPAIDAVLSGKPDAKTTEFGDIFTHVLFETGTEKLRELETKIYVASGRFILEVGQPTVVEYKISEVALG